VIKMAKMTKAQAKRMCKSIVSKSEKLYRWGRMNDLPPSFYTKALKLGDEALMMLNKIK